MTEQQRADLDAMLREHPLDLGGDVEVARAAFASLMAGLAVPEDVRTGAVELGGVPATSVTIDGVEAAGTVLYVHGGAHAIGSSSTSVGLASDIARRTRTTVVSVDYALAPERPYPAGLEDVVSAYGALLEDGRDAASIAVAGESSGGGLAVAAVLTALARGLHAPACVYAASPWADLTLTGASMIDRAAADPALTPEALARRAADYAGPHLRSVGTVSPVFADLAGFPPLLVQVGGNEVLLDDAVRLAARAAADQVAVTLEVTPGVPHVFVSYAAMLDEAGEALGSAARFIDRHLQR